MLFKILIPVLAATTASYADIVPIIGESVSQIDAPAGISGFDRIFQPVEQGWHVDGLDASGGSEEWLGGVPLGGPQFGERGPGQDLPFETDEVVFDFSPVLSPASQGVLAVSGHTGPDSTLGGTLVVAPLPPAAFMGLGVLGLAAVIRTRTMRSASRSIN